MMLNVPALGFGTSSIICRAYRLEHQIQHMKPTSMDQKESFPVKREKSKQLQFVYNAQGIFNFMQPTCPQILVIFRLFSLGVCASA